MKTSTALSFYVRALARVLRHPGYAFAFLISSVMHAAGHAGLAYVAGKLALVLAHSGMATPPPHAGWFPPVPASALPGEAHETPLDHVFFMTFVGLGAVIVKGLGGVYASYVQTKLAGEVGGALRLEVLDSLLAVHRVGRVRHRDQGDNSLTVPSRNVAALTSHVREVEVGLQVGVLGSIRAVAQLVPLLGLLVALSPKLALGAFAVFLPFSVMLGRVRRAFKRASGTAARETEALLEASDEAVRHAELWATYGAEQKVRRNVALLGRAMTRRAAWLEASAAALTSGNEALGAIALVGAIGAARLGWLGGAEAGGRLLSFAVAFFLSYRPLRDLADARLALTKATAAMERLPIHEEAQRDPEPDADPVRAPDRARPPAIASWPLAPLELRDLTLCRGALAPLSLSVGAGEIVAICGPTGVGKTTLLRTLLGLEPPAGGDILFAGRSIVEAKVGPSERPFAWVPQEAPVLADTLEANVGLGGEVEPRSVLEPVGAAHLLESLGDARIGASRPVSGGERQWIAVARALATRLPVLLLDEPTSGLDPAAQARVLEAIRRLRGERSVLMVTHRPEPLGIADRVIRLG